MLKPVCAIRIGTMYRKSFFIILFSLILMGLVKTGAQIVTGIPGFGGLPSSYDPKITVEQATQNSDKPLLLEFYTDECHTCQIITPWVHALAPKFQNDLTLVMVNADDPKQAQIASLFGIQYVPTLFVFDFKHMAKTQVDVNSYQDETHLDKAITKAMNKVRKIAAAQTNS